MDSRARIEQWFYAYSDDIYRFLMFYTGQPEVEDLLQETFIRAFKGFKTYNGSAQPKTWLIAIARRTAVDHMRKNRKWYHALLTGGRPESAEPIQTPEEMFMENEEKQRLYEEIRKLKKEYRDIVLLRYFEGLSVHETADVMGWSDAKVSLTQHRAVKLLQKWQSNLKGGLSGESSTF